MAYYICKSFSQSPLGNHELQGERPPDRPCPTLLFPRRIILQAFHDACQCRDGKPTQDALSALSWIEAKTDWTIHGGPIPPPEARTQFPGEFEWACRWLGEIPDEVRAHGLPRECGVFATRQTSRRGHIAGIPGIHAAWAKAAALYAAKVADNRAAVEEERRQAAHARQVAKEGRKYPAVAPGRALSDSVAIGDPVGPGKASGAILAHLSANQEYCVGAD